MYKEEKIEALAILNRINKQAPISLQTMKQRAREKYIWHSPEIGNFLIDSFDEEELDETITQNYRDTLNIALAGIVDRDIPELCRNWQSQLAYHEAISYNQANATTRAFFQGLLDDIKD